MSKVEFYNGCALLTAVAASPYTYTWTNVPAGSYSLTARAYDNFGLEGNSSPVNITVNPVQCATPTFNPVAGTYASAQSVTISTTTNGATIRYTTDGSTPTETAGTLYSSAVSISATSTLQAIAFATGYSDSTVASGVYTISSTQCATPTFNPVAGTYGAAQSVTISTTTGGATIRYTTNGTTPSSTAGTVYSSAVAISVNTTLQAIAYKSGYTNSTVASGVYTIQCAAPTFNPTAGTYSSAQSVTISTTTSGATINYTTNGTIPSSTVGTVYSSPVAISANATLQAIAYETGMANSSVTSGVYTISAGYTIVQDNFNGTNGTSLVGRAPNLVNLPGGTYIASGSTAAWGAPEIEGDAAQRTSISGLWSV